MHRTPGICRFGLTSIKFFLLMVVIFVPLGGQSVTAADEGPFPTDGFWTDEFIPAGPNGNVLKIVRDPVSGDLYVGGTFTLPGNNIARWDGSHWRTLGSGIDWEASTVRAMVMDHQGNLYAAGSFQYAGGNYVNNIARWDGQQWHTMGSPGWTGIDGEVYALAVDAQDRLYAAGDFTQAGAVAVDNLAMWDGAWHAIGNASFDSRLQSVVVDSHGILYVGGLFRSSRAPGARGVAKWDGVQWSALGSGLARTDIYNPTVSALFIGPDDALYVGGYFVTAGGLTSPNVAMWKGGAWVALQGGVAMPPYVNDLAVHPDGSLYAVANGSIRLFHWDGTQWSDNGRTENSWVSSLLIPPDGSILLSGGITTIDGIPVPHVARYRNGYWTAVGEESTAPNGNVEDLAWIDGRLYAAGSFTGVGSLVTQGVAVWDGYVWSGVGGGLNGLATCLEPDGNGGFYVGGTFTLAGSVAANRVAHWNGSAWRALGSGMNAPSVNDLALGPDGSLYAVGSFTTAGGNVANRVARWNGSRWSALGSGLNNDAYVYALAFDPAGNLYVGGTFIGAGTVAVSRIAKWDGAQWSALGSGLNNTVWDLIYNPTDNSIYASGQFTQAGGQITAPVARWSLDEQNWYPTLSTDMALGSYVRLALDEQNRLITSNVRNITAGQREYSLAWLNGNTWQWMEGSSMNTPVRAPVLFLSADELFIGGTFTGVNNLTSPFVAHWRRIYAQAQDFSLYGVEDTPLAFQAQNFSSHFLPVGGLKDVNLWQIEGHGILRLGSEMVNEGQAIPLASLNQLSYTPDDDFSGPVLLGWAGISTDGVSSLEYTITLNFAPINDPPHASDDSFSVEEDTPQVLDVLSNDVDVDGPRLYIDSVGQGQHGQVTITGDGRLLYSPEPNYFGSDSFAYTVQDGFKPPSLHIAQVDITVRQVNDDPFATDDMLELTDAGPATIYPLGNDTDVDSPDLTITLITQPQHGSAEITGPDTIEYRPEFGYTGRDEFTYTIHDGQGGYAQASINIDLNPNLIFLPLLSR